MKIQLSKAKKTSKTYDSFCDELRDKGYSMLGSGAFAQVFHKPQQNYVLKVVCVEYQFRDDGYVRYLKCIKKSNPLFPRIHSVKFFIPRNTDNYSKFYVVKMEKLIPVCSRNIPVKSKRAANKRAGIEHYMDLEDIIFAYAYGQNATRNRFLKDFCTRYMKADPNVESLDIHDGNVMYRKVGRAYQFVITDPIC